MYISDLLTVEDNSSVTLKLLLSTIFIQVWWGKM